MLSHAPLRLRLTLWYVLLLAVILAVFATGIYMLLRHSLYQNLDESIQTRASTLLSIVQYEGGRPLLPDQALSGDPSDGEHFSRVFDVSGETSFDNSGTFGQVPLDSQAVASALSGRPTKYTVRTVADDDPIRVLTLPVIRDEAISGPIWPGGSHRPCTSSPVRREVKLAEPLQWFT